jgi:4-amino-4-deoxy-L-arabinose transferase-like glycosyltransferase
MRDGRKRGAETARGNAAGAASVRWGLAGIVAFAAVSRLLYLFAYRSDPFSTYLLHDARRYHDWASALATGQVWETGAFYQAPLYPYWVAALYRIAGVEPFIVYGVQIVLGISTILLIFRIARRAYGERAALAATAIASLYGPFVFYETKLLSATAAVFFAALLVERMQDADAAKGDLGWLIAGGVLGAGALANPSILLMLALGSTWIALDRSRAASRRVRRIALFGAGVVLLVAPVTLRNYNASGEWVLISANGGLTFAHGNNPNALGVYSTPPGLSGSIEQQREESRRVAEERTGRQMGDGEVSTFWLREGLRYIVDDPVQWLALFRSKLLLAFASDEQPLEYNVRLDTNPFRWLFPLPFAVILGLAAVRILTRDGQMGPERAEQPLFLFLLVGAATLLGFYVSGRYRLPALPALAAVAGCGAAVLAERVVRGSRSAGAPAATLVAVAAVSFAYVPLVHGELRDQQAAMGLIDRGAALWATERQEEAVAAIERSVELDPLIPGRYLDLAGVLAGVGRTDEAELAILEAIRRDPSSAEAYFELGVLYVNLRRLEDAAQMFATARRLDPSSANAANNLLGTLIHLERMAEAIDLRREMDARGLPVDPSLGRLLRDPGEVDP